MRIKDISVQGFKSFAQKHTFVFPAGITAIVGPNGSGKSNVADAIRWVLGEQRQAAMRARRTEDMIFAGTERRPRSGMAQVSVTFDNADRWLDLDFSEVVVSRRASRDGAVGYAINGAPVRLRDVVDLLGGRLGQGNYTVIGQGMVDAALSLRPEERRGLIDEAAGLVPEQRKRERCLRQLADVDENLTRVLDITEELGPRLQRMSRLARRAEQHRELARELGGLLRRWYGYHWHAGLARRREASEAAGAIRASLESRRADAGRGVEDRKASRMAREAAERELADLLRAREALAAEDAADRQALAVTAAQAEGLAQRRDELEAQASRLRASLEELGSHRSGLDAEAAAAEAEVGRRQEAHQALRSRIEAAERSVAEARSRLEERRAALALGAERAGLERRVEALTAELRAFETRRAALEADAAGLAQRRDAAAGSAEAARLEREATAATAAATAADLLAIDGRREALGADVGLAAAERADRRSAARDLATRLQALEGILRELDSAQPLAERLRESGHDGVVGTIAELLRVDPEWEPAVAAALGPALGGLVVADGHSLAAAMAMLDDARSGPLTLVRLDQAPQAAEDAALREAVHSDAEPRLVGALFSGLALVEDEAAARRWLDEGGGRPGRVAVTRGGRVHHRHGRVQAGASARDLLPLRREWRSLPEALALADAAATDAAQRLAELEAGLRAVGQERADSAAAARAAESARDAAARRLGELNAAHERAERDLAWANERLEEVHRAQRDRTADLDEARRALAALDPAEREASAALAAADAAGDAGDLDALRAAMAEAAGQVGAAAQELAGARGRRATLDAEASRLSRDLEELARRRAALAETGAQLEESSAAATARIAAVAERGEGLAARLEAATSAVESARRAEAGAEARVETLRPELEAAERDLAERRIEAARAEERQERLYDLLRADAALLGLSLGEGQLGLEREAQVDIPLADEPSPELEADIRQLRSRLRSIGHIDEEALATFEESQAHYESLVAQEADLRAADTDLKTLLESLDREIASRFDSTWRAVAEAFAAFFPLLFGGGDAELVLEPAGDAGGQPGLDIYARPPGKRRQPLSLLSGGERALTSVALTFALLEVSQTPFVVLDEVDAALDEANVDRFGEALRRLAQDRQVVVVTHNRGTIRMASTVYGITMSDDGASQVISLQVQAA